jgi:iron complex transport system ATP-binding protein
MSLRARSASVSLRAAAIGGGTTASETIVDGVDLEVAPGAITALIGPNGAGKSTLIRALAGIQQLSGGSIELDEAPLSSVSRRERARAIALIEQDASTEFSMRVADVVALGRTPHHGLIATSLAADVEAVDSAMARTGVAGFARRDFATLSGGERQRVQLARALAQEPRYLLLDEPTSHLDPGAQRATLELLGALASEGRVGVLAAIHDLNLAASAAQQIVVLHHGRVVATGSPAEVLTSELIGEVYGVRAIVLEHPVTGAPLIAFAASDAASPPTAG